MSSSNPFRKKAVTSLGADGFPTLGALETSSTPPPRTSFREPQQSPELTAGDKKNKSGKKVRVLSPPPLSPDSPEWPFHAPLPATQQAPAPALEPADDPFKAASVDDSDREGLATTFPSQSAGYVPANPFSKTLRDLEATTPEDELQKERREEGAALKAGNKAKGALDVNSFQQLLMSGIDAPANAAVMSPGARDRGRSPAGFGGFDGQLDGDYDDDGEESISDSSQSAQLTSGKKPPPPPSSRHGKSIKLQLKNEDDALEVPRVRTPTDVNKPLPPAPLRRSFEDEAESPFDQESAGKIPEPDVPVSGKKPIPAPPPPRGHSRSSSKANSTFRSHDYDPPSRSSMDSTRSASDNVRPAAHAHAHAHAPAPPPPRRPNTAGSRQSTLVSSPGASSITGLNHPSSPSSENERSPGPLSNPTSPLEASMLRSPHNGSFKLSGPPPPPSRNSSVRRPASVRSIDSTTRRVSGEPKGHNGAVKPPPPPRRHRGNSRGSMDGPPLGTGTESASNLSSPSAREVAPVSSNLGAAPTVGRSGMGVDILADLDALQREVDALRKKAR